MVDGAEVEDEDVVAVDLMSTLDQMRKEMGGPFLDKSENLQLKAE